MKMIELVYSTLVYTVGPEIDCSYLNIAESDRVELNPTGFRISIDVFQFKLQYYIALSMYFLPLHDPIALTFHEN